MEQLITAWCIAQENVRSMVHSQVPQYPFVPISIATRLNADLCSYLNTDCDHVCSDELKKQHRHQEEEPWEYRTCCEAEPLRDLPYHVPVHCCDCMSTYALDRALALEALNMERLAEAFKVVINISQKHGLLPVVIDKPLLNIVFRFYELRQCEHNLSETNITVLQRRKSKSIHKKNSNSFASDNNETPHNHTEESPFYMGSDLIAFCAEMGNDENDDDPEKLSSLEICTILQSVVSITLNHCSPEWWEKYDDFSTSLSGCTPTGETPYNHTNHSVIIQDPYIPRLCDENQVKTVYLLAFHHYAVTQKTGSFHSETFPPGFSLPKVEDLTNNIRNTNDANNQINDNNDNNCASPLYWAHVQNVILEALQTRMETPQARGGSWHKAAGDETFCIYYRRQTIGSSKNKKHSKKPSVEGQTMISMLSSFVVQSSLLHVISVLSEVDLYSSWVPYYSFPFKMGLRKTWKVHDIGRTQQIVGLSVDLPWPMSRRQICMGFWAADQFERSDALFVRLHSLTPRMLFEDFGLEVPKLEPGVVQMEMEVCLSLVPLDNSTTHIRMLVKMAPGASVSQVIVDFVAKIFSKSMISTFCNACHQAARQDSEYRTRRHERGLLYGFLSNRLLDIYGSKFLKVARDEPGEESRKSVKGEPKKLFGQKI